MESVASAHDPVKWVCPFANTPIEECAQNKLDSRDAPMFKPAFIAAAVEEARHVPHLIEGFNSYQRALDEHQPFSLSFIYAETQATFHAINQLENLKYALNRLVTKALPLGEQTMSTQMREQLDLVRSWVAKHRQSLIACHVFYKLNYTLARDVPDESIIEKSNATMKTLIINLEEEQKITIEVTGKANMQDARAINPKCPASPILTIRRSAPKAVAKKGKAEQHKEELVQGLKDALRNDEMMELLAGEKLGQEVEHIDKKALAHTQRFIDDVLQAEEEEVFAKKDA